jgi:hypothetical protein
MQLQSRTWWRVGKAVLGITVVVAVAWQFVRILQEPEVRLRLSEAAPDLLGLSAVLYVCGLLLWASFWLLLLRVLGERPGLLRLLQGYFASHLGKYVPGKAWALFLRTTLAYLGGVRLRAAALTSVYETLTTMTAGALLAVGLLAWVALEDQSTIWLALALLPIVLIPIYPPVFNRLADRVTALAQRAAEKWQTESDPTALPPLRHATLAVGLVINSGGWLLLGLSLWVVLRAVAPEQIAWSWSGWLRCTGYIALSYVAGFLAFFTPGGLGVREGLLQQLVAGELIAAVGSEQGRALAWGVALLLRLLWVSAEVIMAAALYLICSPLVLGLFARSDPPADLSTEELPPP